jgi:hypothetical protein
MRFTCSQNWDDFEGNQVSGITQIWERLFIGSAKDAGGLAESNPLGIRTVITLCEAPMIRRNPDINHVHVAIADGTPITVGQYQSVMDAIWQNIGGNVLLHCVGGMSRTPVVCSAWMHVVGYRNIDAALEEIAKLRPSIDPSPILLLSIREHLK